MTLVQRISCGGKTPRQFTLDPTAHWLLCGNQDSASVTVFRRDAATGQTHWPHPDACRRLSALHALRLTMFARKLTVERIDSTGQAHLCPIKWIDSFSMRNFTNDAIFDDTLADCRWRS